MKESSPARRRLMLAAAMAALLGANGRAFAQSQSVSRIFVGFPPGGLTDILARAIAPLMDQPDLRFIVENKPGASGQLAVESVRQSKPESASLVLTPASIVTLVPQLYRKPLFDPIADLSPVGAVVDHSFGFSVTGNSPIRSMAEFIDWAKANPAQASYATPGTGTVLHYLGLILGRETGTVLNHIPYRGTEPGINDLIGGQVAAAISPLPALLEYHRAGRIRILAVTNPERVPSLPDVPTFSELGLPALELVEWYGLFASSKLPANTLERLEASLAKALDDPAMETLAKNREVQLRHRGTAELQRMLGTEYKGWTGIVKESGIRLDN